MTVTSEQGLAVEAPTAARAEAPGAAKPAASSGAIFHPVIDFLLLGGLSLIVIPILMLLPTSALPVILVTTIMLADVINHPHFAHSYQLFYRDYRAKAFGDRVPPELRWRYLFAGIGVPVGLAIFMIVALSQDTPQLLGYGGNLMLLTLGWHYTKQGYGLLMVDAAFKKRFFNDAEKKILRINAHTCWVAFWVLANSFVAERNMWGISYYAFDLPDFVMAVSITAAVFSTVAVFGVFANKLIRKRQALPWTGVMAYLVSAYIWLIGRLVHPAALFVVPLFHSLQYLAIVWRFEINRTEATQESHPKLSPRWRLAVFGIMGILLGLAGFWWIPKLLSGSFAVDVSVFGPGAWFFVFWISINVHHYFMDNVIWRRENPDTRAYLFAAKR